MTDVKCDAELCERLEREAREDAAAIKWADDHFANSPSWPECGHDEATCPCFTENDKARSVLAKATLRTRDNLRAMADQLAAARAEIERLTDTAAAAIRIADGRTCPDDRCQCAELDALIDAQPVLRAQLAHAEGRFAGASVGAEFAKRDVANLEATIALMSPVVEAAEEWRFDPDVPSPNMPSENALEQAVDAYRAARDKAGR